jgi:putative transposase
VSTYYHAKEREVVPSARETRDAMLKDKITEVWKTKGREVYGARKVWLELNAQGVTVARCTVERLMRDLGLPGVRAGRKRPRTTVPEETAALPSDLLDRHFDAPAPNRRWVADITYVPVIMGDWVYAAFVMDLFARRILGWQVADHLRSDLAIDALEMAIWTRRNDDTSKLVHHSDRGVQYTSIRYTKRLEEAGAVRSVGSKGDSYDNAAAESLNSLYKRELIDLRAPWQGEDDVMVATGDWVQWYNEERIHSYAGDMSPKKYEEMYYKALASGIL